MARLTPLLLLFTAPSLGCAEITYDSHELRRTILHTEQTYTPVEIRATVRQRGPELEGQASRICDAYEMKEVQRRVRLEPKNRSLPGDLVGLGFGVTFAAIAAGLLVDAKSVYPSDRNGRLYNPNGPGGAYAAGGVLAAIGGLILLGPAIDLARTAAAQPREEVEIVKESGARVAQKVPCVGGKAMAANERVTARAGGVVIDLGATDAAGRFSMDLGKALTAERLHELGDPARLQLWVGSSRAGDIELTPPAAAVTAGEGSAPAKTPAQLAISPEDAAQAAGAVKSAKEACQRACAVSCSGKQGCTDACAAEACK